MKTLIIKGAIHTSPALTSFFKWAAGLRNWLLHLLLGCWEWRMQVSKRSETLRDAHGKWAEGKVLLGHIANSSGKQRKMVNMLLNVSSPEIINPHLQRVLYYFPAGFTQSSTLSFSWGSANVLCKKEHSKHLRLAGSYCLCCTFSTQAQSIQKQWAQLYFSNTLRAVKCGLPIIFIFNEISTT